MLAIGETIQTLIIESGADSAPENDMSAPESALTYKSPSARCRNMKGVFYALPACSVNAFNPPHSSLKISAGMVLRFGETTGVNSI